MKKLLLIFVLMFGVIFVGTTRIGAKMNNNTTQVTAQHILVMSENEAVNLKNKIEQNEITFEDAAKEYSQCPSGKEGGNLGSFGRGVMVKEFEDAAFNLELNKVSAPVQTQFGWHLIKVTDKK